MGRGKIVPGKEWREETFKYRPGLDCEGLTLCFVRGIWSYSTENGKHGRGLEAGYFLDPICLLERSAL